MLHKKQFGSPIKGISPPGKKIKTDEKEDFNLSAVKRDIGEIEKRISPAKQGECEAKETCGRHGELQHSVVLGNIVKDEYSQDKETYPAEELTGNAAKKNDADSQEEKESVLGNIVKDEYSQDKETSCSYPAEELTGNAAKKNDADSQEEKESVLGNIIKDEYSQDKETSCSYPAEELTGNAAKKNDADSQEEKESGQEVQETDENESIRASIEGDNDSEEEQEDVDDNVSSGSGKKNYFKKTKAQRALLEEEYRIDKKLTKKRKMDMAQRSKLPPKIIQDWFYNMNRKSTKSKKSD